MSTSTTPRPADAELKPCPFCGGRTLDFGKSKIFVGWIIECFTCEMIHAPSVLNRNEAIAAWNRRASEGAK